MKVAVIQMNSCDNVAINLEQASQCLQEASKKGAKLAVLPENFAYLGENESAKLAIANSNEIDHVIHFLEKKSKQFGLYIVAGSIPRYDQESQKAFAECNVYNPDGNYLARYHKIHLFDVIVSDNESYCESDATLPGGECVVVDTEIAKLGLAICYDLRFPELFRTMHQHEVEMVALPSAFTKTTGESHWEVLVRARAIENQIYLLAANQTGVHPGGRETFGHSMIVDPWGKIVQILPSGVGVIVADIDLDGLHQLRRGFPCLAHRRMSHN